jgi:hypothetical protein
VAYGKRILVRPQSWAANDRPALLDRLTHRVHILEMNGEGHRFRESVRRILKKTAPQKLPDREKIKPEEKKTEEK